MKIAIVGAGVGGLSCALEFEKHGIVCDIYEKDNSVGWIWPSVSYWPKVFTNDVDDIVHYLNDEYDIGINYSAKVKQFIMKSANKEVKIKGNNLGYFVNRGKLEDSLEKQMERKLTYSPIFFSKKVDYSKLAKEYDHVIVGSGGTEEVKDLGIWEELDKSYIYGGIAVGSFDNESSTVYFNTEYAGVGYARVTPINASQAVVGLYAIGLGDVELKIASLFNKFIEMENLSNLDFIYHLKPNAFQMGRVKKVRIGNVLLIGRSAGLTERLIGVGGYNAIISGILAARAIINKQDYEELIEPLKQGVENISAFRNVISNFKNDDFDRLVAILGLPAVKQIIYNTDIDFADAAGRILKHLNI